MGKVDWGILVDEMVGRGWGGRIRWLIANIAYIYQIFR